MSPVFSFNKFLLCILMLALFFAAPLAHAQFDDRNNLAVPDSKPVVAKQAGLNEDTACALPKELCGDKPKFGSYWNNFSASERRNLLVGFDVGLSSAWQSSYLEGEESGSIRSGVYDRRFNLAETYAGAGIDFMVNYFNQFYAEPVNNSIDWTYAWLLASLAYQEANNGDAKNHDERYLKKFLQTYGELPGWVRIVDVLDADKIEIEVLVPEPYRLTIKLRGVTTTGSEGEIMTADQKNRAMRFIKGLSATRGYPFKNCGCTEMVRPQLFYGSSFFTADGTMEAYVRINESSFCLMREEISNRQLDPDSGNRSLVLNEILLTNGLAFMDEESTDYMESDSLTQSVENAREKGWNVYGKNKIPAIEKAIKQGAKPVNQNCLP